MGTRPAGIKAKAHTPNKGSQTALITRLFVSLCLKNPDNAGRVAPISACVLCLRFLLAFNAYGTITILQKLYLPSILHLTLTRRSSLTINTLISVRCYNFHLHATYTPHTLPHGTSTGE